MSTNDEKIVISKQELEELLKKNSDRNFEKALNAGAILWMIIGIVAFIGMFFIR